MKHICSASRLGLLSALLVSVSSASAFAEDFTFSDIQYWVGSGTNESALVVDWNDSTSPDPLVFGYKWNTPASGDDPTVFHMMVAFELADSYLRFYPDKEYDSPSTGDYALYASFYNLTGGAGPTVGSAGNLGGHEKGYAPAGDHYKEGWDYNGFWGELLGDGDPYDGGSWDSFSPEGVAVDTISNGSWAGLSFSTDETNYTVPDPGFPDADFPLPAVPEPSGLCLLPIAALGLFACSKWKRRIT